MRPIESIASTKINRDFAQCSQIVPFCSSSLTFKGKDVSFFFSKGSLFYIALKYFLNIFYYNLALLRASMFLGPGSKFMEKS